MSLSKNDTHESSAQYSGKVVMGAHTPGPEQMTLQEIEGKRQLIWDDSVNDEYLERVKEKAKEKAKEIIMMAELEAEAMRATARHEGYQEGLEQAQEDVNAHIQTMSTEVENLMTQIGSHGSDIFHERKKDIVALIKLAVEKTLGIEVEEKRMLSLESLMIEALDKIESQRRLTIKCSPGDAGDLEAFITTIQERNPRLKYWTVKGDSSIQDGGVIVESADGKIDNTTATRWNGVQPILEQLANHITTEKQL